LRPRNARPSTTETYKDDEVAPSHGLPQKALNLAHILLSYGAVQLGRPDFPGRVT
jgi:hypothetical protein